MLAGEHKPNNTHMRVMKFDDSLQSALVRLRTSGKFLS